MSKVKVIKKITGKSSMKKNDEYIYQFIITDKKGKKFAIDSDNLA